ncbi:MAG: two pore domain potassium channel family protein [Actinomycetales bacterium]|nr:two pore domain potassium channel family protein [Actinomycetales bacterium]
MDAAPATRRHRLLVAWATWSEWPLAIVALAFVVAYSWEIIGNLDGTERAVTEWVVNASWALFVLDYLARLVLADNPWRWFRQHLLQLAMVALPILRPLRVLQVVIAFQALQRRTGAVVRGRVVAYAAATSALLIYMAAISVLDAERDTGDITNLGDALWWAFVTVTTVGYGDYYPVTPTGRLVAVGLMLGGIALIGVVTATLASWIVERVGTSDAANRTATTAHVDQLQHEIAELRELIERHVVPRAEGSAPVEAVDPPDPVSPRSSP